MVAHVEKNQCYIYDQEITNVSCFGRSQTNVTMDFVLDVLCSYTFMLSVSDSVWLKYVLVVGVVCSYTI